MDLASLMGGMQGTAGASGVPDKPGIEYTAQAASRAVNGEVKLKIADKSFSVTGLFDAMDIPYSQVNGISFVDYTVRVKTDGGDFAFSRMGEWAERFHDTLCDAYNKAVLRSMFIKGRPIVTAFGDYRYSESGASASGKAPIHVYDNCVVVLPPDLGARRIPLCFVSAMDKGDFSLTLRLDTGESYTFSKLGYDTDPIEAAIEKQIRALREKAIATAKQLDPSLDPGQAMQIAKLTPEGAAAEFGRLDAIAPSFSLASERKINQTRAAEYFAALKELCTPSRIYAGFVKEQSLFWFVAPSPNGRYATVEFSETDTATFVYKTGGMFSVFAGQLSRALEAISFKREVIRLPDDELRKPEYADYFMASKRTAALQFVRRNFIDRVIHTSPDAWKSRLLEVWNK